MIYSSMRGENLSMVKLEKLDRCVNGRTMTYGKGQELPEEKIPSITGKLNKIIN